MGHPRRRIFRLPKYQALFNRCGLGNSGIDSTLATLESSTWSGRVGISVIAVRDIATVPEVVQTVMKAATHVPFVVLESSCPNISGGYDTKEDLDFLDLVLRALQDAGCSIPLWVKISPELSDAELAAFVDVCIKYSVSAIVAGNTASRHADFGIPEKVSQMVSAKIGGTGGLSGKPLFPATLRNIRRLRKLIGNRAIRIVACGGISSADEAWQCIRAGASLVEILTGLIYEGPALIRTINEGLLRMMREHGYSSIADVVGSEART